VKLAILGGTFDPVHAAHLAIAEAVRDRFGVDRVLLVPAHRPPHKGRALTAFDHRLAMVQIACRGRPRLEASACEASRAGPSYTVDTLAHFRAGLEPADPLFFVLGSDSLADLPSWREPDRILRLANLIVAPRPGAGRRQAAEAVRGTLGARIEEPPAAEPPEAGRIYWLEVPESEVSGSDIRRRVRGGAGIGGLVPAPVAEYILRHRLYG
jgi:nicotinate-nucleotide adenylyltransferase